MSELIQLKAGFTTEDKRLDRVPGLYDERSRLFAYADTPERKPAPHFPAHPTLNQRNRGACVWFSIATAMNASPRRIKPELTDAFALEQYHITQHEDPWDGCEWGSACPIQPGPQYGGTAVLTGLKVAKRLGMVTEYRWCFTIDEVVRACRERGVLFGVPWYRSMFNTREGGHLPVDPSSGLAGYHATYGVAFRYAPVPGLGPKKREHVVNQNTWGPWGGKWFGVPGHSLILVEDLERHLLPRSVYGEAAVLMEAA